MKELPAQSQKHRMQGVGRDLQKSESNEGPVRAAEVPTEPQSHRMPGWKAPREASDPTTAWSLV